MQCPKLSISLVGLPRETRRLFKSPKVLLQPSISLPPEALTICMENPKIPGRIRMEWFTPVEIFRKKSNTFRGITETAETFCTICLDYQYQPSSREKAKNLPVFCKWYNSMFLFSVPKKIPVPFDGTFSSNFPTNGKRSWSTEKSTQASLPPVK